MKPVQYSENCWIAIIDLHPRTIVRFRHATHRWSFGPATHVRAPEADTCRGPLCEKHPHPSATFVSRPKISTIAKVENSADGAGTGCDSPSAWRGSDPRTDERLSPISNRPAHLPFGHSRPSHRGEEQKPVYTPCPSNKRHRRDGCRTH
jgi:hypothetical protein